MGVCLGVAFWLAPAAAPVHAIELREAVARTLRTSPDVGIVVEERRATGHEVDRAGGLFLPTVDFRASAGEEYNNDAATSSSALPRYQSGLTLKQLLFDGSESESELAFRTARRRSASRRVLETSQAVALDAVEAYLESLRNRGLVALAEATVTAHEQTFAHVREIAQGGAVGVADVKQAESRLARANDDLARARNRLDDADAAYRRVVGEAVDNPRRPDLPEHALARNVADAVARALRANPAVKVAQSEVAEAEAEYRKSKSNFWPKVNFEVAGNSSRNVDGSRGTDSDVSALVVLNYNLYRGGADVARRQAYIARLAKSRQQLNRAVRGVEEQARLSWNALRNGRDRVTALKSEVRANEIVRATYREQFDLNQRSLLDLLDSENDLFIARANLITSEFTVMFGVFRVLATAGDLLAALNVAPPPEAADDGLAAPARKTAPAVIPRKKAIGRASPLSLGRAPPRLIQGRHADLATANPRETPKLRRSVVSIAPIGRASALPASVKRLPDLRLSASVPSRIAPIGRASAVSAKIKRLPE